MHLSIDLIVNASPKIFLPDHLTGWRLDVQGYLKGQKSTYLDNPKVFGQFWSQFKDLVKVVSVNKISLSFNGSLRSYSPMRFLRSKTEKRSKIIFWWTLFKFFFQRNTIFKKQIPKFNFLVPVQPS